jgi:trans-aconitate methyltransferase
MTKMDIGVLADVIERSVNARGVTPEAVWLDREGALDKGVRRCEAIFRMIDSDGEFTLLDVGCGPGLGLGFLEERYGQLAGRYCGVDVSDALLSEARKLWPRHQFLNRDIIADPLPQLAYDFTAINGVLTCKYTLSHEAMESFAMALLEMAWKSTRVAMSFNVMSPHVDWMRDDLFHWPLDRAMAFCVSKMSRNVNIIADYGLYEYTLQVFRESRRGGQVPRAWQRQQARR